MGQFPQLIEDDFQQFNAALTALLTQSEASTALIVEKAGYLIQQCGASDQADTTTVATLASNAFNATQFMASLIQETNFSGMYQQGENFSTLILNVEENTLLVIIFKASLSVGMIKYYASNTIKLLATQLEIATARAPGKGFDLIDLDATDLDSLFQRKDPNPSATPEAPVEPVAEVPPAPAAEPLTEMSYLELPPMENRPPGPPPVEPVADHPQVVEPVAVPPSAVAQPVVCQKAPIMQWVAPGTYFWCACGRSKTQPFCDGSHAGTGIEPHEVVVEETQQLMWCACKHSKNKPYCDGTHRTLP